MALQYILGNAGSGKTEYLYSHVIGEAIKHPEKKYLVIVPEQFTMQTQREFVLRHPDHCIMNIDVLSFDRLAYRVFDELGLSGFVVLEDTGKNLVLRKIAEENREQLKILKNNIEKPGYIDEVKSLLSELTQYKVTPDMLRELNEEPQPGVLGLKLHDICLLYEEFKAFCSENYVTAEEILTLLAQYVENSKLVAGSTLIFDGFTGFTPVQNELVEKLMKLADDMIVTVLMDEREDYMQPAEVHELFYMSKKFIRSLNRIAKDSGTEILEPIVLKQNKAGRFAESLELAHLEKNIFRKSIGIWQGQTEDVNIYHFEDPKDEIWFAAEYIAGKVQRDGYRYRDFAVVTGALESYGTYVEDAFAACGIPCFVDVKGSMNYNVLTECVRGCLEIAHSDYSYQSVFRLLKTGLVDFNREETDLLENYCIKYGIRGVRKWKQEWRYRAADPEELQKINEIRGRFVELLEPSMEVLRHRDSDGGEKTRALYRILEELHVQEKLEKLADSLEENGQSALSKQYRQIYRIFIELLDKYVSLLGTEKVDAREYLEVLDAGIAAAKIGVIPPGNDCVIVGDIERTRLEHIKVLLFVGVNEGVVPGVIGGSVCLSQREREIMEQHDIELAPTPRDKAFMQQFYLYMMMTKPSRELILTYSKRDSEGKVREASYLIAVIHKLFPKLSEKTWEKKVIFPKQSLRYLTEQLQGEMPKEQACRLLKWYLKQPEYKKTAEQILEAGGYHYEPQRLDEQTAALLYGKALHSSVTRLEKFSQCPYAHFMGYGLKLRERETMELDVTDTGTLLHDTMEILGNVIAAEGERWSTLPETRQDELVEQAVATAVERLDTPYLFENARNYYNVERMKRIIRRSVRTISRQVAESGYEPLEYEVKFDIAGMVGKVDRVDVRQSGNDLWYRVVDYKSGNKKADLGEVFDGRQLQLLIYMDAAKKLLKEKYPDRNILTNGGYYYHLEDPMILVKTSQEEQDVEEKIYETLKLTGFCAIPDESVEKKSVIASQEDMEALNHFAKKKAEELAEEILTGDIRVYPYRDGQQNACTYCAYKSVCRFDDKIKGYEYRKCEKRSSDEIMQMIKEADKWE